MKKVVDKTITPLQTLSSLSVANVTGGSPYDKLGYIPIGAYKGQASFFDLDQLVNQPSVLAERSHILGILDGREEDYDLQTLTIADLTVLGSTEGSKRARLTVPSGEVWYISAVVITTPADAGGTIHANWRCSLWEDRADTPDDDGQAFHDTELNNAAGDTWYDEFGEWTTLVSITNKLQPLRLPAGSKITLQVRLGTANATGDLTSTLKLYGYKAKALLK